VSPVRYELGFYIPKDDICHSHRRGNLKSYISYNKINVAIKKFLVENYVSLTVINRTLFFLYFRIKFC
jgi:hypothetical protein